MFDLHLYYLVSNIRPIQSHRDNDDDDDDDDDSVRISGVSAT